MGFHLFADYQSDGTARAFQGTIGFQQTFYQGEADRSLVLGRIIANPSDDIRVFGLVMIDLYGSDEIIKSSSAEVTQLVAQASFRLSPTSGAIASVIHTTWPELKREEYVTLPEALIADGYVDRLSASWWTKLSKAWRVSLRSHYWQDQNGDGFGGEASVDWSLPTASPSSLYASVYHEESAYTTGDGLRAQVQTQLGSARLFVGYDGFAYSTDTATTDDNFYLRHTLRADVGWGEGQWYWDVDASYTLGDLEQSVTIGLTVQYRF